MKKAIILILFFVNALFTVAQITFEKTYMYSANAANFGNNEYKYFIMDVAQSQCRIYDTNHDLYKTISLSVPDGYYLSDIKFVTKNLFNTDDLIELLYIYEKYVTTTTGYYVQYGLAVVNESGNSLLTLSNGGWAEIIELESESKLFTYSYLYNTLGYYDVTTNVYSITGTLQDVEFVNGTEKQALVYPNPANEFLVIDPTVLSNMVEGEFVLFTISGKQVLAMPINKDEKFTIPINNLPAGMYVYSLKNKNKLIQSSTFIIQ